jgi:Uma2 family endonuclease
MTAALSANPPSGGWTTDDLDNMPEDGLRRELVDGALLVSPSPTDVHGIISGLLFSALYASCPREFQVSQTVEIRINPRRSFIPDLVVATDQAARRRSAKYSPDEVVLAIEIVSPTSTSMGRITKPALYATAGIPYFWRIETDGAITVHTYKLDREHGIYQPVGTFDDIIDTDQPWSIKVPISSFTPRYL